MMSADTTFGPKIAVIGVGGAGGNAVDNMIRLNLDGVTFLVCNTDLQALNQSLCLNRVRLGFEVTQGLGAGSSPEVGRLAAEESIHEVMGYLDGVHMLFITAGMGGGTGTGGAPVIAKAARERGILTVGVVTKPFHFEGTQRMKAAEKGIEVIKECVDTLLIIPNQNLFRLATETTTFAQSFAMADDILYSGVRMFTDLMLKPGLVNLDFADICTVLRNMNGKAMMGTGEASGEHRANEAAEKAIGCLLLDDVSVRGASAVLINITGGPDLTLYDVDEAIGRIKREVASESGGDDCAHIIFGATFDGDLRGALRVSVVATGIDSEEKLAALEVKQPALEELINYESLGSRHGDYTFDEQHLSSFSLREDSEEFGYQQPEPTKPEPRKRSFFDRLTGRHKEVQNSRSAAHFFENSPDKELEKSAEKEKPTSKFSEPNLDIEDLEIPAFLRQKYRSMKK